MAGSVSSVITAIGFSGGFLPGQLAIQAATFDLSAHCFAVVGDRVIDGTYQHGVKERKLSEIKCNWMDFCPVDYLTVTQNLRLEYWLRCQIGKKYDTGFIFGWPLGRSWQDPDEWTCSELIGAGLVEVGAMRVPKMHRLTPRNLRRRIEEIANGKK
jgi:hypothetical protein